MTLALYADPKHPEEAHETYTFSFVYSPDGEASMTIDAKGDKSLRSKTKVEYCEYCSKTYYLASLHNYYARGRCHCNKKVRE